MCDEEDPREPMSDAHIFWRKSVRQPSLIFSLLPSVADRKEGIDLSAG